LDFSGAEVDSAGANPVVNYKRVGDGNGDGDVVVADAPGASGYQYDPATKTWQFNWQTKGVTPGRYNITIISNQTLQSNGPFPIELK